MNRSLKNQKKKKDENIKRQERRTWTQLFPFKYQYSIFIYTNIKEVIFDQMNLDIFLEYISIEKDAIKVSRLLLAVIK